MTAEIRCSVVQMMMTAVYAADISKIRGQADLKKG